MGGISLGGYLLLVLFVLVYPSSQLAIEICAVLSLRTKRKGFRINKSF